MKSTTHRTTKTNPYDSAFQQHLTNHGIYPPKYKYPSGGFAPKPSNWDEIFARTTRPRASLSSATGLAELCRTIDDELGSCAREVNVSCCVPLLRSKTDEPKTRSMGCQFKNLAPLTDGTLTASCPDVYYGARPESLDPELQLACDRLVSPSKKKDEPMLPNFFMALKGPSGELPIAENQACYDGAFGARALSFLISLGSGARVLEDGRAYTITCTLKDGVLRFYTCHLYKPRDPRRVWECAMTLLCVCVLNGSQVQCKDALTTLRNLVEWAQETRDAAINLANDVWRRSEGRLSCGELLDAFAKNKKSAQHLLEHKEHTNVGLEDSEHQDETILCIQHSKSSRPRSDDITGPTTLDGRITKRRRIAEKPSGTCSTYNLRPRPGPLRK